MAIINNQSTENGDVLYIETTVPAIGITALIGFVDDTEGEIANNQFNKTFQYSTDGITWSQWENLTIANIQSINVNQFNTLFLKYRYQHQGSGILEFNENIVTGTYEIVECPYYFNESIFKKYFSCNDLEVLKWYINVSEKLYHGELNKYLKFDNGINGDETDAISFWQSIAKFFAFYVILSRVYRDFYLNEELINNYLEQRGLFTSQYNILSEYNNLMQNFNNEISRRGTRNILNKKGNNNIYDGELRRYLNLNENDEFVFNYFLPHHCGWWIDRSSPMYRGLEEHLNANQLKYENYCLTGSTTVIENPDDKNDVLIQLSGTNSGIQYDNSTIENLININRTNNYILEFDIRVLSNNSTLTLGANCYSTTGISLNNSLRNFQTNVYSNYFVQNLNLNTFYTHSNDFFKIKCIVFNISKPNFSQDKLNIGIGNNLKFQDNSDIRKFYPIILGNGNIEIKNLYVRPLYTEYERGFISMNHFVSIIYKSEN